MAVFSPSTADRTEIDGVIMPSPYSSADPNNTSRVRAPGPANGGGGFLLWIRPNNASVPPSPSWSARSTNIVYFTQTARKMDHRISDNMPVIAAGSFAKSGVSWNTWRTA